MDYLIKNKSYLGLIILPVLLSIIVSLISSYNHYTSFIIMGGIIIIAIAAVKIDIIVYLMLAIWPFVCGYLPENITLYFWFLIALLYFISLLSLLLSNRKFHLPPKEIIYFFAVFWMLVILSDIANISSVNIKANVLLVFYTMLIFMFYDWSYNKSPIRIFIFVLFPLVVAVIMILFTIINNMSFIGILQLIFIRYCAFFGNPNTMGNYFNYMIPVLFVFVVMKYPAKLNKILLVLLILSMLGLLMSNSRAAYLGVMLSLFSMSMVFKSLRKPVLAFLLIIIIALIVYPTFQELLKFILRIDTEMTSGRMDIWASAINTIKENFIFGVSIGNQQAYLMDKLPTVFTKYVFKDIPSAHNLYLSKVLELGILALPLLIYLFISLGKYIRLNLKSELTFQQKVLNYASLGALISLFARSFFEGSVLIQQGGIFPIFYSWIVMFWPLQIYQKNQKEIAPNKENL